MPCILFFSRFSRVLAILFSIIDSLFLSINLSAPFYIFYSVNNPERPDYTILESNRRVNRNVPKKSPK
jgi:hypothetical protein